MNIRRLTKNLVLGSLNLLVGMLLTILIYHQLINWLMSVGATWSNSTQIISVVVVLTISAIPFMLGTAGLIGYVQRHLVQTGQIQSHEGVTP